MTHVIGAELQAELRRQGIDLTIEESAWLSTTLIDLIAEGIIQPIAFRSTLIEDPNRANKGD